MTMLTIFSDASFCPKMRVGGWGAWAKRDIWERGRFYGGELRRAMNDPNDAELYAALNAFLALEADQGLAGIRSVMLQSDSINALGELKIIVQNSAWSGSSDARDAKDVARIKVISPTRRWAAQEVGRILDGRSLWLRHVKGHSNGTGRNWVNAQCDAEARRHMLAARRSRTADRFVEVTT